MSVEPAVLALNGPTASGKSGLAVQLALQLIHSGMPAEVVNTDAMCVYRGMDIGTAKPTLAERAGVPHHLIDVLDVADNPTVAWFQTQARDAIAEIRGRGVVPILVGGSALYMRAILDDFDFPATDVSVRARYESELAHVGPYEMHRRLSLRDPQAGAHVQPGNGRRIVRALEVLELTGRFSPTLPEWTYHVSGVHQIGLALDRPLMDERIATRVDRMWEAGLVAEVRALEDRLRSGVTAQRALGYQQVLAFLAGEYSEAEAQLATVAGTRRFARKQLSWWRRDARITWFNAGSPTLVADVLAAVQLG